MGATRRRRVVLVLGALAVPVLAAYFIASAAGFSGFVPIQLTGAFELDGNAVTNAPTSPPYDWDKVYLQCGGTSTSTSVTCPSTSPGTIDGASARAFLFDPVNSQSDDIFTGGGSKDNNAISGWLWKTAKVGQPKDDLEHAYAAQYQSVQECDHSNPTDCANHQLLFFGTDRYSNGGDSDVGFWFLRSKVSETTTSSQGGFTFTGHHSNGDVLVLSTFVNGGAVPQVAIFEWKCPGLTGAACDGAANQPTQLAPLTGTGTAADCVATATLPAANLPFCATTNAADGTHNPWPYTEASANGNTAGGFGQGTFFEGGIDLTNLGLDNQCFSSFVTESRASQSINATLSDLLIGGFAPCTATMTTNPTSTGNLSSLVPGTSVTDTATVTGHGLASPPYPTSSTVTDGSVSGAPGSNVTFSLCGPDSATTCTTLAPTESLSNGTTPGVSTATSPSVAPTTPGKYCFHASWGGDTNYPGTITETNSADECFTVAPLPTATVTTPGNGSGAFTSTNTPVLGGSAFDKAVVTAFTDSTFTTPTGAGGYPSGTVTFYVCDPTTLTSNNTTTCSSTIGTEVGTAGIATSEVANASPLHSQSTATSSPGVTLNKAGLWCFAAHYTPGGPNGGHFVSTGSGDQTSGECFTVPPQPTATVTMPVDGSGSNLHTTSTTLTSTGGITVYDSAVVTGAAGAGNPSGSVAFSMCGPVATGTCDATASADQFDTETSSTSGTFGTDGSGNPTWTVRSTGTVVTKVGTYCFYAKYTPDTANYTGSNDGGSTLECFTIKDSSSATSAQSWIPSDAATISTAGGNALNGTLKFTLYPDLTCNANGTGSDTATFHEEYALSNKSSGTTVDSTDSGATGVTGSVPTVTIQSPGSWSWWVEFSSSDPLVAGSKHCEHTALTIVN